MKKIITLAGLAGLILMLAGCVTRTYSNDTQHRGARSGSTQGDITEKKRIWFWQDEFRNP